jgi:glutaminase
MGADEVLQRVSVEPSGDTFNSIELQPGTNRPFNPMINSGAIAVTALLHGRYGESTIDCIVDRLSTLAGRKLTIDEDVYASERRTGHRNRAIAHLLLNFGLLHPRRSGARRVFQAVRDRSDLPRSGGDGGVAVNMGATR